MAIDGGSQWWLLALHGVAMTAAAAYALGKERQELGCSGFGVQRRQCRDEHSVYVRGTSPDIRDDAAETRRKLVSVLSYHEKGGVWKRCFLLATVLAYVSLVMRRATKGAGVVWWLAAQHLVFFAIMYFYWNFINYHHFRLLKRHGVALVDALLARCH